MKLSSCCHDYVAHKSKFLIQYFYICDKIRIVEKTLEQYNKWLKASKDVFIKKTKDYGTAWRILRPSSLTDQLLIKAFRIRSIEELGAGKQKIDESVDVEYIGLVNYGLMALIQLGLENSKDEEMPIDKVEQLYDEQVNITRDLMIAKNHDYGEIWRKMRTSSLTDLILMKLKRVKQIEDNDGKTIISEGLDANYMDIINYSLFALIQLEEKENKKSN